MKVIQIPYTFYPEKLGGTEIYVLRLAKELIKNGIEVVIVYPGEQESSYEHNGMKVRTFRINKNVKDVSEVYGADNDSIAFRSFSKILENEKPDIIHFHSLTSKITKDIIREIKRLKIPIVFTYHTPTVTCQRGTLLKWGKEVCNGLLDIDVCTKCTLNSLGLPRVLANIIGSLPEKSSDFFKSCGLTRGIGTILRMRSLTKSNHSHITYFLNQCDKIITVCNWTKELLITNNIPESKITVCKHGLTKDTIMKPSNHFSKIQNATLRIVFIGRISKEKGLDLLIKSFRKLANLDMLLDVYGIVQGEGGANYLHKLKRIQSNDNRINLKFGLSNEEILKILPNYDLIAVPSQWMETGPLVILEAFSASVPVLGSNLGGIAELVEDNINGLLVKDFGSIEEWSNKIKSLFEDRSLLAKLKRGTSHTDLRTDSLSDLIPIYNNVIKKERTK